MKAIRKSTIDHLFHSPSRQSSISDTDEQSKLSRSTTRTRRGFCRSTTASSCELFSLLKALAASSGDSGSDVADEIANEAAIVSAGSVDEATEKVKLEEKMRLALGKTAVDSELLGSRLAALSLTNPEAQVDTKPRPLLPRSSSYRPDDNLDATAQYAYESSGSMQLTSATESAAEDEPSDEEKIQAIIAEYGSISELQEGTEGGAPEPERMLAECRGSLFKGIMVLGKLHLTTHRLLFHAQLPPDSMLLRREGGTTAAMPDVLIAGPVTLQKQGPLKSARRLWMEIGTEMITTYPNGDEVGRTRPLQTLLLSSVRQIRPFDPANPRDFIIYVHGNNEHDLAFSVDTEQSALQWRRAMEAALYRHARRRFRETLSQFPTPGAPIEGLNDDEWATMRCSVPLDRVQIKGISNFHDFALLVGLQVDMNDKRGLETRAGISSGNATTPAAQHQDSPKSPATGRNPLRFLHTKSRSGSREASPSRRAPVTPIEEPHSPLSQPSSPARQETHYLDSQLPHRLGSVARGNINSDDMALLPEYDLHVAILNEQQWFAEALQAAVGAAAERRYRPGVSRPRMRFDIGGFDCFQTDEDLEVRISGMSRSSDDYEQHEDSGNALTNALRKVERAALAAKTFGLEDEEGVYIKRCYFAPSHGMVPLRGHIIISKKYLCFWRRVTVGADVKYRYPFADVKGVSTFHTIRAGFHGMAVQIHGQHDVKFEFWSKSSRDEVISHIEERVAATSSSGPSSPLGIAPRTSSPLSTPVAHPADILAPPKDLNFQSRTFPDEAVGYLPFIANHPFDAISRIAPRHFVCLTIGSRGDVQPYIALCLRLKEDNHRVTIVTHAEFREWIESYGIEHRQAGGDPTALMKLSTDHKMFSPGFFKESLGSFRQWLDDLLLDSWHACHDAAVLIESPSTMSGIHIAEALKIPYFRAFTMPWTRTTAYPQAFMVPAFEMGPSFNYSTYVLFDSIMWRATSGQINRWRKKHLHLPATDMDTLSVSKVPFLYNFSPAVVPKALDWSDDVAVTGYWNLENSDAEWSPPESLEAFMKKARDDSKPLVYIGFGSIVVPHPNEMTQSIISAVEKADVRAIIAKGWSSRGADPSEEGTAIQFPASCYGIDKIPHGWLFPKIDAALHHGGAGTVGASLRAGLPTLIKPWFGDQFFWAIRVSKLGVGLKVSSLRAEDIAHALTQATTDKVMIEKAARIGERIRSERGVDNAVQAIQANIIRAGADRSKMGK